jgi:hypothetical protein
MKFPSKTSCELHRYGLEPVEILARAALLTILVLAKEHTRPAAAG